MLYASESTVGKRSRNEDKCITKEFGDVLFAAVADGMGGHAAGDVASRLTLDTVIDELSEFQLKDDPEKALKRALNEANLQVYRVAQDNPEYHGMGSTVVCVVLNGTDYTVANVGDSRVFKISGDTVEQISQDHSLVWELYKANIITEEDICTHPLRNIITRSIGNELTVSADFFTGTLLPGETLLLCSDGLHGSVSKKDILDIVSRDKDLKTCCRTLIDTALDNDSSDNITVVLISNREDNVK